MYTAGVDLLYKSHFLECYKNHIHKDTFPINIGAGCFNYNRPEFIWAVSNYFELWW